MIDGDPQEILARLREANKQEMAKLVALGRRPDPGGVLLNRIDALARFLLNDEGYAQFEIAFERAMADALQLMLAEAQSQTAREQLLKGVQLMPNGPLLSS